MLIDVVVVVVVDAPALKGAAPLCLPVDALVLVAVAPLCVLESAAVAAAAEPSACRGIAPTITIAIVVTIDRGISICCQKTRLSE